MGYALSGWADLHIEVRYVLEDLDQFGEFLRSLRESPMTAAYVTVGGGSSAREGLGAMAPGLSEHATWVHVQAPVELLQLVLADLIDVCNRVFPRVRGEDGEGPTASY